MAKGQVTAKTGKDAMFRYQLNLQPPGRIRLKARVDLSDQAARFYTFKVISTIILTYFSVFWGSFNRMRQGVYFQYEIFVVPDPVPKRQSDGDVVQGPLRCFGCKVSSKLCIRIVGELIGCQSQAQNRGYEMPLGMK